MANNINKILIVSENKSIQKQLDQLFSKDSYEITRLKNLDRILKYFEYETFDLLIISGEVSREKHLELGELLGIISKDSPQTQILLLVKEQELEIAIEAQKAGGYQYIRMPAPDTELELMVGMAIEKKREFGQNKLLINDESVYRFVGFIGGSPSMQKVYKRIEQVAPTNIPVLLLGETGTGKDLAARAIHQLSKRQNEVYTPVNLGSLPSELVASELFGHEKGSFTGATNQHKGVFETATSGTVFLDEIDSVDQKVQISLLRLLEQKKLTRLGGRRSIRTNARVIAACNENLEELVAHGNFREDLYFRLDVFRIVLPPLRERISDILLIAEEFIAKFGYELKKDIIRINPGCVRALEEYDWPGNVRELKNVLLSATLVCEGEEITEEHLPKRLQSNPTDTPKLTINVGQTLDETERLLILKTLTHTGNNRKKAAELLGITRRALYNKLHKHNIL